MTKTIDEMLGEVKTKLQSIQHYNDTFMQVWENQDFSQAERFIALENLMRCISESELELTTLTELRERLNSEQTDKRIAELEEALRGMYHVFVDNDWYGNNKNMDIVNKAKQALNTE